MLTNIWSEKRTTFIVTVFCKHDICIDDDQSILFWKIFWKEEKFIVINSIWVSQCKPIMNIPEDFLKKFVSQTDEYLKIDLV